MHTCEPPRLFFFALLSLKISALRSAHKLHFLNPKFDEEFRNNTQKHFMHIHCSLTRLLVHDDTACSRVNRDFVMHISVKWCFCRSPILKIHTYHCLFILAHSQKLNFNFFFSSILHFYFCFNNKQAKKIQHTQSAINIINFQSIIIWRAYAFWVSSLTMRICALIKIILCVIQWVWILKCDAAWHEWECLYLNDPQSFEFPMLLSC